MQTKIFDRYFKLKLKKFNIKSILLGFILKIILIIKTTNFFFQKIKNM